MFKNKTKPNEQKQSSSSASAKGGASNSIVAGTSIIGDIIANNDIRIDGTVEGTLDCKGRVIIGPTGSIEGKISCINAIIEGTFKGNLVVKEQLNVKDSANISGDIKTEKLLVQSGAIFNVSCNMSGQVIKSLDNSATKNAVQ